MFFLDLCVLVCSTNTLQDCNICTCDHGNITCETNECPGELTVTSTGVISTYIVLGLLGELASTGVISTYIIHN